MNTKYLIGGIGGVIFSFSVTLFVFLQYFFYFENIISINIIYSIFFWSIGEVLIEIWNLEFYFILLISIGNVLIGIGVLEFYLSHRRNFSIIIFIFSLVSSFFLIIYYSSIRPFFNTTEFNSVRILLWDISFSLFASFFILIGINLIIQRKITKFQYLTLISGVIIGIFGSLFLIFSNILLDAILHYESFRFFGVISILSNPNLWHNLDFLLMNLMIFGILRNPVEFPMYFLINFAFLPLGFTGILIGIIFFIEAKGFAPKIKIKEESKKLSKATKAIVKSILVGLILLGAIFGVYYYISLENARRMEKFVLDWLFIVWLINQVPTLFLI